MTALKIFAFEDAAVRIVDEDGGAWFVGADVARVLGYRNPQAAIRRHCKGMRETLTPSDGGDQMTVVIPEGDVYRLVIRSKLPEAERFERWVMDEVLPALRRTGSYTVKAAAFDRIATARGSVCITDGAKPLQVGPKELFQRLHKLGWIYRRPNGAAWLGYEGKVKDGLIEHKVYEQDGPDGNPRVRTQVRITARGLTVLAQMIHVESVRIVRALANDSERATA